MNDVRVSKMLSLVLRHDPGRIGIELDGNGWVAVPDLRAALDAHGTTLTHERLAAIVAGSDKQRFALDEAGDRIRANQGHSVDVDLGLTVSTPPASLFHGTLGPATPVLFAVDAAAMHGDGHVFSVSANGVWLVESVPARYLTVR